MGTLADISLVALGGLLGAVGRFLFSRWASRTLGAGFPSGTLLINFLGSLLIGFFLVWTTERVLADPRWRLLVAIGFCGAFTTYSSYAFETLKLYEEGAARLALINVAANNLAALTAVVLGAVIARKIA
jgi:CrcB protein